MKRFLALILGSLFLGEMMTHAQQPANAPVDLCYVKMQMAKPPLKHLHFQATLRNTAPGPRWFVFPASFYEKPSAGRKNAGIFAAEVFSDSERKVVVASLLGTYRSQPDSAGGLKALLLPAGAVITLRDFRLSFWGDDPSRFDVRVQIAGELTIGGIPLEKWVGTNLLSAPNAAVGELNMIASKSTPDNAELAVQIKKLDEPVIQKPLARRCQPQ